MLEPATHRQRWSVTLTEGIDAELKAHLLRGDGQEDLCFALYTSSVGAWRRSALVHQVILPGRSDREVHGNVSLNPQYLERVAREGTLKGSGVVFLHGHLGPGWQDMSVDDIRAEREKIGPFVDLMTGHPLVGMTLGTDGAWSARAWEFDEARQRYKRTWAGSVRVVGARLGMTYCDSLIPPPAWRELFRRTATAWGPDKHRDLARLRVGIVGLGSVGGKHVQHAVPNADSDAIDAFCITQLVVEQHFRVTDMAIIISQIPATCCLLREFVSPDAGVCWRSCWTLPYFTCTNVGVYCCISAASGHRGRRALATRNHDQRQASILSSASPHVT